MMQENGHRNTLCDLCMEYVSGLCSEEEQLAFEAHLPSCPDCRREVDELRFVWEALPGDMERIKPPPDLKHQVMGAAIAAQTPVDVPPKPQGKQSRFRFSGRRSSVAVIAGLAVVLAASGVWNFQMYRERHAAIVPVEQALSVSAAQIEQLIPLKPQTGNYGGGAPYAVACIVDNGQSKQFVVYVFGAARTSGEEAYQVWLIRDGERSSAGTFRVDDRGIGVMAMPIASASLSFDAIGITLEPDDRGDQPRGAKMFGSA